MLDFVPFGIFPVIFISTEPLANILIEETEKPLPLLGQLPSVAEHFQLTVVFLLVDMLTEAPVTLWLGSPSTLIVPLYDPGVSALGGSVTGSNDCETCRQTRAMVGLGVAVWGTWVLVGTSVSVGVPVSVGVGVMVGIGVKVSRTKPVEVGNGVEEAAFSILLGPFPTGVQVGGIKTGVGVFEGRTIDAGRVGGGNGLKAEAGLEKMETTIMPTTHNPINVRIERASQTENFMKLPAFPRDLP